MLRCATYTRCGQTSSGRRQGAKTSQVRSGGGGRLHVPVYAAVRLQAALWCRVCSAMQLRAVLTLSLPCLCRLLCPVLTAPPCLTAPPWPACPPLPACLPADMVAAKAAQQKRKATEKGGAKDAKKFKF